MTVEQTTTFTIADLSHVIVTCRCGATLTFSFPPAGERQENPDHEPTLMLKRSAVCPCGKVLWSDEDSDSTRDFIRALFAASRRPALPVKLAISQVKS